MYLILGLLAGLTSAAYIRLIFLARDAFHSIHLPEWAKPALAGALVGLTGMFLPQIFGVGYPAIEAILKNAPLSIGLLLALLLAKLLITPISLGGGFIGGVFAPALFLGASLGGAFGMAAGHLFPALGISAPSFALVGMAAVLAGTVHAPLTAILLLFEMTNDYHIILPLMFSVAVSLAISRRLQSDSIYHHALARNGIRLEHGRDIEVLDALRVDEVMTRDIITLQESDSVATAPDLFNQSRRHGLPVLDSSGRLVGMLTLQDIDQLHENIDHIGKLRAGDICMRELVTVHPDESLATALHRMSARDIGRLPVVSREDPSELLGILRRNDVIRAYELALTRRMALRHHIYQARLGILSGVEIHEVSVQAGSTCAGKRIKEIVWPHTMVIASIRRGQTVVLPHGDTSLRPGDVLLVVCEGNGLGETQRLCQQ